VAQVVSRPSVISLAWVRSQVGQCEICGGQTGTEQVVLLSQYVGFPQSLLPFHQCSIVIFLYVLLLLEIQTCEAWRPSGYRGALDRHTISQATVALLQQCRPSVRLVPSFLQVCHRLSLTQQTSDSSPRRGLMFIFMGVSEASQRNRRLWLSFQTKSTTVTRLKFRIPRWNFPRYWPYAM